MPCESSCFLLSREEVLDVRHLLSLLPHLWPPPLGLPCGPTPVASTFGDAPLHQPQTLK